MHKLHLGNTQIRRLNSAASSHFPQAQKLILDSSRAQGMCIPW